MRLTLAPPRPPAHANRRGKPLRFAWFSTDKAFERLFQDRRDGGEEIEGNVRLAMLDLLHVSGATANLLRKGLLSEPLCASTARDVLT